VIILGSEKDDSNPLGIKGIGENGVAAAIACGLPGDWKAGAGPAVCKTSWNKLARR
jgi:hypothetical protein